jgi:hypothetical protein
VLVFIFAIRQKSNVKVTMTTNKSNKSNKRNQIYPTTAGTASDNLSETLARVNSHARSQENETTKKILAISRRNLRLALVTVASTFVAMVVVSWGNWVSIQPDDSPATRTHNHISKFLGALAGLADVIVNCVSVLMMTSSWQPCMLKKALAQIRSNMRITTRGYNNAEETEESVVSTLGGGY